MSDRLADWWDAPMRTEFGRRFHQLFEHPCDGYPYAPTGFEDGRDWWVRVEDVMGAVRLLEDDMPAEAAESRAEELVKLRRLLANFVDTVNECWFDHHGDCQAHGVTSIEPGELCPNEEAKRYLTEVGE